MEFYTSIRNFC